MEKEHDMLLNMLANPHFTLADFENRGFNGDNTGILEEEKYANNERIQNIDAFKDKNGNFDRAKFSEFYKNASAWYNSLSNIGLNDRLMQQVQYSKDNIWVDQKQKTIDYTPKLTRLPNERLVNTGLSRIGKKGQQTLSISEIAQTLKVWDNEKQEWTDSPNDSFFSRFFDTLVLASYDDDVYDDNGKLIHQKGEYKLNDNGTYYYETLGGRDPYGKQVLNKMNIITTDGSFMNQFDFFDSDDMLQKSTVGSILKNAALVGSMFIPYVGPVIRGLSVATQSAGLFATLGKIFLGNENSTLNNIQGWAKSVNRQGAQTEYASQNTWCVENMLNMIGDTIGQLAEQRWIFQAAPALFKGKDAYRVMSSEAGLNAVRDKVVKALDSQFMRTANTVKEAEEAAKIAQRAGALNLTAQDILKQGVNYQKAFKELKAINQSKAAKYVDDLIKQSTKIGSPISKAYMTGITVLDTYGEAKAAGASDMEAALLTIGYAAGEAWILNTGLGEWILPELHGDKFRMQAIAKALTKDIREQSSKLALTGTTEAKQGFILKLLNIGRKIATNDYARFAGTNGIKVVGAHALGESFEEVSEELLADFSKTVFNITKWMRGEEGYDMGQWDNMLDRYGMSALGGLIGGGLTSAATDFSAARNLSKMSQGSAIQLLLYYINNNKEGEFLKLVDKMGDLGNKNLSAKNIITSDEDGIVWAEGDKNDNQNQAAKQVLHDQVRLLKAMLDSEGARLSSESLLNKLTTAERNQVMRDIRFWNLRETPAVGRYLQEFLNLQAKLVSIKSDLKELDSKTTDGETENDIIKGLRLLLNLKLLEVQTEIKKYTEGKLSAEAIRDGLFWANPMLSSNWLRTNLVFFAEHKFEKKWNELSDSEKATAKNEYKKYIETNAKNDAHVAALMFHDFMDLSAPVILQRVDEITKMYNDPLYKQTMDIQDKIHQSLFQGIAYLQNEEMDNDSVLNWIQTKLGEIGAMSHDVLAENSLPLNILNLLEQIKQKPVDDNYTIEDKKEEYKNLLFLQSIELIDSQIQPFIKLGYINPETRNGLKKYLDNIIEYALEVVDDPYSYFPGIRGSLRSAIIGKFTLDINHAEELKRQLTELPSTPIIEMLNLFKLSVSDSDLNITKLIDKTILLFDINSEDISDLTVDKDLADLLQEGLNLINAFDAVIRGMQNDNGDIDNPFGYSKTLNEVYRKVGVLDYVKLPEIDTTIANQILKDNNLIKRRFEIAIQINAANNGQRLKMQDRVSANKNILLYNAFKRLSDSAAFDDWESSDDSTYSSASDELKMALELLNRLPDMSSSRQIKLTPSEKIEAESELRQLEETIYRIFDKNKNSDGTFDIDKLSKFLKAFAGTAGFFTKNDQLLNENTSAIDDNAFIWYLFSRAAVRSTDFYGAYSDAIKDNTLLAPIPTQELATYLGVAAVLNGNMLNSFVQAYRNTVILDFNSKSESERKLLLDDFDKSGDYYSNLLLAYFGGHDVLPQYENMIFIEGAPGTGKSTGVFSSVIATLNKIDPNILQGALYVHATKDAATEANTNTGLNGTPFSREEFLRYISSEWKDISNNSKVGSNGQTRNYLYEDSYFFDKDGRILNKWKLNTYANLPKVIFIDEIGHYNLQELSMIEQFAKENQIIVITAGDLDLITLKAYIEKDKLHILDVNDDITVSVARNFAARSPKLGVSLRSTSRLHDFNMALTQVALNTIRRDLNYELRFKHHSDDRLGLFGVYTYNSKENTTTALDVNKIKSQIELMVKTLKSNEKIGYIYSDNNSELKKYLETNYGDKIRMYKGSDAQGLEGQYYIVENQRAGIDALTYLQHLYTGISRAKQGVIAIIPLSIGKLLFQSLSEDNPNYEPDPLKLQQIEKAHTQRLEQLQTILSEGGYTPEPLKYIAPNKSIIRTLLPPALNQGGLQAPAPLPPVLPPVAPPSLPTNQPSLPALPLQPLPTNTAALQLLAEQDAQTWLNNLTQGGTILLQDLIAINNSTSVEYSIQGILAIGITNTNNDTIYYPMISLSDGNNMPVNLTEQEFNSQYSVKLRNSIQPVSKYAINSRILLQSKTLGYTIKEIDLTQSPIIYKLISDDGTDEIVLNETDLSSQYQGLYVDPVTAPLAPQDIETGLENDVEGFLQSVTGVNVEEDDLSNRVIQNHLNLLSYSFDTFEIGLQLGLNGELLFMGEPINNITDPELRKRFKHRIDAGIGLSKIINVSDYDYIVRLLGNLYNEAKYNLDNSDLANRIKRLLGLPTNTHITVSYGIKSSAKAGNNSQNGWGTNISDPRNEIYARYDQHESEQRLFTQIGLRPVRKPNQNLAEYQEELRKWQEAYNEAAEVERKKLTLLVNIDGKNKLELPLVTLASPLTIMQMRDADGNDIFPEVLRIWSRSQANNMYDRIKEITDYFDANPDPHYTELINLFKFWQFTSNGWFPMPKDFNLAKYQASGPQLVKRKGNVLIDGKLLFTADFIDILEFIQNPSLNVSSIFSSKEGLIQGIRYNDLNPGHSFVLVSDSNKYKTDQLLVDRYIELLKDPGLPKEVKRYYIIPPSTDAKTWLENEHTKILNAVPNSIQQQVYDIGNDFTGYRIIDALIKTGQFDQLESSDGTKQEVFDLILQLNNIEEKWNLSTIQFGSRIYNGRSEEETFNQYKQELRDENSARKLMATLELKYILNSTPHWTQVSVANDPPLKWRLNSYLTGIVWFKDHRTGRETNQNEINRRLDIINQASLAAGLKAIAFRARYSPESVGPFIKIHTMAQDKYSLGEIRQGVNANFKINAKIDTSSFVITDLSGYLYEFNKHVHFDTANNVWRLDTTAKNWEKQYLDQDILQASQQQLPQIDPKQQLADQIYNEYKNYVNSGLILKTWYEGFDNKLQALQNIALQYTKRPGHFGFTYNGKLYLTEIQDHMDWLILDPQIAFYGNLQNTFTVLTNNGNIKIAMWMDTDQGGIINKVQCRCTNYKYVNVLPLTNLNIDEVQVRKFFEEEIIGKAKGIQRNSVRALYSKIVDSNINLIDAINEIKQNTIKKSNLINLLEKHSDLPFASELLNYLKEVVSYNLNVDNIVLSNNKRYLIISMDNGLILANEIDDNNQIISDPNVPIDLTNEIGNLLKEESECIPNVWKIINI